MMDAIQKAVKDEVDAWVIDNSREIARRLIRLGRLNLEEISLVTGLSISEVEDLAGRKNPGRMNDVQISLLRKTYDRNEWRLHAEECEMRGRILGTVETMRDDGKDDEQIVERLMLKYCLKKEEAEKYSHSCG